MTWLNFSSLVAITAPAFTQSASSVRSRERGSGGSTRAPGFGIAALTSTELPLVTGFVTSLGQASKRGGDFVFYFIGEK